MLTPEQNDAIFGPSIRVFRLKLDFYIDDCLLVELKAVETVLPIHKAQLFSYMKLLAAPIGLLINFHAVVLKEGIYRMMLPGAQS